jgi:hypothetical protein
MRESSTTRNGRSLSLVNVIVTLGVLPLVAAGACDVPPVQSAADLPNDSAAPDARDTSGPETSADTGGGSGGVGGWCEPQAEVSGCAEGLFCDNRIRRCVECLIFEERCDDSGVRETCEVGSIASDGSLRGGAFARNPCAAREACVPLSDTTAACQTVVCAPSFATCVSGGVRKACNAYGTEEVEETCDPGRACYEGVCEFIRHNVVLVFDTSGSMHDYVDPAYAGSSAPQCEEKGTPCLEPFPVCDSRENPLTLVNLSKKVFSDVISDAIGGYSQFALQRFPQREAAANIANCFLGWYLPLANNRVTGDDESVDTATGSWFSENLTDVIAVPFPPRNNRDNSQELLRWFDDVETLGPTEQVCSNNLDCGTGKCGSLNGERRCFVHSNPELRAGGETPLGKSLFYAGEYIRRFVRVGGKPCASDVSCGSAGYVCRDDVCVDPYGNCKDDFIILFTDGDETEFREETEFFHPAVQAKRLAFGLSCSGDADCRGDATCEVGLCVGRDQDRLEVPTFATTDSAARVLTNPWGHAVSVRTTVITLNSRGAKNARIAYAGGGVNLEASSDDPDGFRFLLRQATSPDYKCSPEELP